MVVELDMKKRPSQGTHKTRQRERAAVERSRNCQKMWRRKARGGPPKGWITEQDDTERA